MQQGHDVIWPIADEYYNIRKHFQDIQFVRKSEWNIRYDHPAENFHQWEYGLYQVKPLRWNMAKKFSEAMTSKYSMYGIDPEMWRTLTWERDMISEMRLAFINNAAGKYQLICNTGGNITDGGEFKKEISFTKDLPIIYLDRTPDFTLLDWATVIENATIIHAVSSSSLYLFETLNLKAKESTFIFAQSRRE